MCGVSGPFLCDVMVQTLQERELCVPVDMQREQEAQQRKEDLPMRVRINVVHLRHQLPPAKDLIRFTLQSK